MGVTKMYIVRGVPNADMLMVVDAKNPTEKFEIGKMPKIGIEGLEAPRVGREPVAGEHSGETEFGFEAREFVRKAIIGKQIKFVNGRLVPELGRELGEVYYQGENKEVLNLGAELVKAGLASVSKHAVRKDCDYARALAAAEIEAMEGGRGKYAEIPMFREEPLWRCPEAILGEIAKEHKGKEIKGVVESVFAGHAMKIYLPSINTYCTVQLTGVICDKKEIVAKEGDKFAPSAADKKLWESIHHEARSFAERCLNHREMTFIVEGVKYDNLVVTVKNGARVFQEELLKQGLASIFQPTASWCAFRQRLKDAENAAKAAKVGRWANLQTTQKVTTGGAAEGGATKPQNLADFKGTVIQIQSADTLIVLLENGKEQKCQLANVRAGGTTDNAPPKAGEEKGVSGVSAFAKMERMGDVVTYKNWYLESRDFMGKMVLGKTVDVKCEYMSTVTSVTGDYSETRANVTLYLEGSEVNPGAELIKAGFAVPLPSRDGESRDYFAYCDAFDAAKAAKRGLHGNKRSPDVKVQDMARPDEKKGKAMLTYLQRSGAGTAGIPKLKAFVEYVLSPMRFKLFVPRENVMIALNVAGIVSPLLPMPNTTDVADPCAQEALNFTKKTMNQREVEIQVEHFHKGTFVGNIYLNGKNFAPVILSNGLATMEGQNTQSMSGKSEAADAEAFAQKKKLGIWAPEAGLPKRAREAVEKFERRQYGRVTFAIGEPAKRIPITVTEAESAQHFYFHTADSKANLAKIKQALHAANPDQLPVPAEEKIVRDTIVAARYSADKTWYRARVLKKVGKKIDLSYIDFGNRESTTISEIRLHPTINNSIPPQANAGRLAFIHDLDAGEPGSAEAMDTFASFVEGREVTAAHEYTDNKQKYYTIRFGDKPLQAELVKRGESLVALNVQENKDLSLPVGKLMNLEKAARQARAGMWAVIRGDPRQYDDEM